MDFVASLHPTPQAWLRYSALAPHIDAYGAYLRQGRYATNTTRGYLNCVAHFAHWITQSLLPVDLIDEKAVRQFLDEHLPSCNCHGPVMRVYGVRIPLIVTGDSGIVTADSGDRDRAWCCAV